MPASGVPEITLKLHQKVGRCALIFHGREANRDNVRGIV